MVLPKTKQVANDQASERRHTDPPALWIGVTLTSVVLHIFAFGLMRLLLAGTLTSFKLGRELIPVDLIAVAPNATSAIGPIQTPGSVKPRTQTPRNTPPLNNPTSNSSASRTNSRSPSIQPKGQSPTPRPAPNQPRNNSPSSNSANSSSKRVPSDSPKPNSDDSASNRAPSDSPKPNSDDSASNRGSNQPPASNSGDSSSSSSNNQSNSTSSGTESGGGFVASVADLRLSFPDTDVPSQLAKPRVQQKKFASNDAAAKLVAQLEQPVVLEVLLRIDRNGTPKAQSAKVLQGNSTVDPTQLAEAIVQNWQFEPTQMEGSPVEQEYYLRLNINPLPK
ncbi:MAG TPA: hypothetical protein V6C85_20330 [Allocoleopsis sp.]